jgi:hypothetical protein
MVAVSRSSTFHRFTVYYSEGPVLHRILVSARFVGAEPVLHFTRLAERSGFKIELMIGGLSQTGAESFATRMQRTPGVSKVMWGRSQQTVMQAAE